MKLINKKIILYIASISIISMFFIACNTEKEVKNQNDVEMESTTNEIVYSGNKYNIEVSDDKDIIRKCPKAGKSGEVITIKANEFMDVIPKIFINGEDIGSWNKNRTEYSFVMPNENVEVTTKLKSATN